MRESLNLAPAGIGICNDRSAAGRGSPDTSLRTAPDGASVFRKHALDLGSRSVKPKRSD
jgi:hypothetical protein